MYLFMDVLFNQPRNAGSSTSLTTSFALVLNFPHPPSTLTTFLFILYFICSIYNVKWGLFTIGFLFSIHLEDWGFRKLSFTSALSSNLTWESCWWFSNLFHLSCLVPLFNFRLPSRVLESAERPKWPSPVYHSPCHQMINTWYFVAAAWFFTACDLHWA